MANPICLSPLKFYDTPSKQEYHKSYAFGHISPLVVLEKFISPFQFVLPEDYAQRNLARAYITKVDGTRTTGNIVTELVNAGFAIETIGRYNVAIFPSLEPITSLTAEGNYYLELYSEDDDWAFFSEVFCYTNQPADKYLSIEYWNRAGDFSIKGGLITFSNDFRFQLYLDSELGKPEYNFEEEATKRLGYAFIESQVSKKIYKFNAVLPEYICDAMRLIRLCSDKKVISKGETYDMLTFDMEVDWQTQGDLASVSCEFETDNVIVNVGSLIPQENGDFRHNHFNDDFDNQ